MKRSYRCVPVLLVLLAQVTACQPESEPSPGPAPDDTTPDSSTGTPQTQTSPFSLTSSARAPDPRTPVPEGCALNGLLTTDSALGILDFRYDAFVLTAQQTGTVVIQGDVISANPNGYRYGYGYPLSMASIEDGVTFTAYGGSYVKDALETGTAIIDYPVAAGRQYVLVYKTFGAFTPQTYCLTLPSALKVEGRIYTPPAPVPIPTKSEGPITLENPRPEVLGRIVPWLNGHVADK
ncbi:hypothetical protein [Pyxidicoccus sp. MSG2]|uniref:hypothetical protein n=1 Tax=Pyxidicoccus sp. MSG2 TaxID=2996790 RepID=UPI00226DEA68|nr:hypothetical protein [Pyxidicoccus sp. MSG2]MCY1023399.1 hypothetical protein [Pyxidicoccus sp. MSG2]